MCYGVLQCVIVCCSVLWCVVVCYGVLCSVFWCALVQLQYVIVVLHAEGRWSRECAIVQLEAPT